MVCNPFSYLRGGSMKFKLRVVKSAIRNAAIAAGLSFNHHVTVMSVNIGGNRDLTGSTITITGIEYYVLEQYQSSKLRKK